MGTKSPRPFTEEQIQLIIEGVLRGDRHRKILDALPGRNASVLRVKIFALRKSGRLPPATGRQALRLYTEAEDAALINARHAGRPYKEITMILPGRSVQSLQQRFMLLTNKEPKPRCRRKEYEAKPEYTEETKKAARKCLGCGDDFRSTWIGNRMCPGCKHHKRDYAPYSYEVRL